MTPRLWLALLLGLLAIGLALYVPAVQWWNSKLQSEEISLSNAVIDSQDETDSERLLAAARDYNFRLWSSGDTVDYPQQLNPTDSGLMGRIKIPKISVDLPIYHGTSDAVLLKGAGHLEDTSLPVGGTGTHAAISAHRGLAESRLFTDLDKVKIGDSFTIEVLGQALVYEVEGRRIVQPTETDWLKVDPERDLVTLITCDPIGVNTERILVTGKRVTPTPERALEEVGDAPTIPGFPWWIVVGAAAVCGLVFITWWSSRRSGSSSVRPRKAAIGEGSPIAGASDDASDPVRAGRSGR